MIEETVAVEKRKKGGQPGNQNARKIDTMEMWSCRLPDEIIEKIRKQAEEEGMSQGKFVAMLVETYCG